MTEFSNYLKEIEERKSLGLNPKPIDDGVLLENYPKKFKKVVGIEPSDASKYIKQKRIKLIKSFYFKKTFKIPVICIGNIYVGGTGKTPLSLLIAKELLKLKKRPAIIRKYYKEHIDEYNLVKNDLDCLFLAKNRSTAIENAEKNGYQLAILDDGFQDFSIVKNLNILCFNSCICQKITLISQTVSDAYGIDVFTCPENAFSTSAITFKLSSNTTLLDPNTFFWVSNPAQRFIAASLPLHNIQATSLGKGDFSGFKSKSFARYSVRISSYPE